MLPLLAALALALVLVGVVCFWAWTRSSGPISRVVVVGLGPFSLRAGWGAALALDVSFDLHHERGVGLVGELRDGRQRVRARLGATPLRAGRVEVAVVSARGRRAELVARELLPSDEDFAATSATSSEESLATPLVPADMEWEGVRLRGPRRVRWVEPQPRLIVAGMYMAGEAALAAARPGDWAFALGPSPTLVIDEGGAAPTRVSVARAHGEHLGRVEGLSISWAMPERAQPPGPPCPSRREGGAFAANVGLFLSRPAAARTIRVHAEVGHLRSEVVEIVVEV